MAGLSKIQAGVSATVREPNWNDHSQRQRAIAGACEQAVQLAREKWQVDLEKQSREIAAAAVMDFVKENGIELPAGVTPLGIVIGKGEQD